MAEIPLIAIRALQQTQALVFLMYAENVHQPVQQVAPVRRGFRIALNGGQEARQIRARSIRQIAIGGFQQRRILGCLRRLRVLATLGRGAQDSIHRIAALLGELDHQAEPLVDRPSRFELLYEAEQILAFNFLDAGKFSSKLLCQFVGLVLGFLIA